MTITVKDFKDALKKHKSIRIEYVNAWDRSSIHVAHIDNDYMIEQLVPFDHVLNIKPTPEDAVKKYNCL